MVSPNQILELLNQPFLQHKSRKKYDSFHVDTNSQKLKVDRKFFGSAWYKMGVPNLVCGL